MRTAYLGIITIDTILLLIPPLVSGYQCELDLEAENALTDGIKIQRSETSGKYAVLLYYNHQYVIWTVATTASCFMQVQDVVYANDGPTDLISLYVNSHKVGSFQTKMHTDEGNLWNHPVSSGKIGNDIMLPVGNHTIKLEATNTEHGVEIDVITLGLICNSERVCSETLMSGDPDNNIDTLTNKGHIDIPQIVFGILGSLLAITGIIVAIAIAYATYKCKSIRRQNNYVNSSALNCRLDSESVIDTGCGYSTGTGTQVRVPVPYIRMGNSHACAMGQVAVP